MSHSITSPAASHIAAGVVGLLLAAGLLAAGSASHAGSEDSGKKYGPTSSGSVVAGKKYHPSLLA